MTDILDPKAPTPEEELADEIKAYEEEQAKAAKPDEPEPEPEIDGDGEEIEAASDDEDADADQDAEAEGSGEAEEEGQDEGHKGQRQVPLKALQAEREERARLQREFDEMRGQMSAFMQMFNQQPQQPQEQPAPPPDPEEDPIGAIKWMNDQLKAQQDWRQQQEQERQTFQQREQIKQMYARNAQQFAQETPDFNDAYRHLLSSRANELKLQGYDDSAIGQVLEQEELGLAISSLQNGINPAARIYELARARGYNRSAPKQPEPAKPLIDPEIEDRKKAAALNTNRSNPPKAPLKPEDLANLEGAAFDKAWEKLMGPESRRFV